jgi:hypothetical protein
VYRSVAAALGRIGKHVCSPDVDVVVAGDGVVVLIFAKLYRAVAIRSRRVVG